MRASLIVGGLSSAVILVGAANADPPVHRAKPDISATPPSRADSPPVLFDFKGAKLGMSFLDWRALPYPGGEQTVTIFTVKGDIVHRQEMPKPTCSNDPASQGDFDPFYLTEIEKNLQIVECRYKISSGVGDTLHDAGIDIGERHAKSVTYSFLEDKLYEIVIIASDDAVGEVLSGLHTKFGEPTSSVDDITHNRAGGTFPHMRRIWSNPVATIIVESPWSRIDDLNVTYLTTEGVERIEAARKVAHPESSKM